MLTAIHDLFLPPTQPRFAAAMLRGLRELAPHEAFTYDAANFCLRGSGNLVIYLGNMHAEYRRCSLAQRRVALRAFCMAQANQPEVPRHILNAEDHILVRVRERFFYDVLDLQADGPAADLVHQPLNDLFCVEVVYDTPHAMATVNHSHLKDWRLSVDDAIALGLSNLRKLTRRSLRQVSTGVFMADWHDTYDAARLLLTDTIVALPVRGAHVAFTPNRETLLVTGADDLDGLRQLLACGEKACHEPRLMSLVPVVLNAGRWTLFTPPPGNPLHVEFKLLRLQSQANDYDTQAALLQKRFAAAGTDIFLASLMVARHKNGMVTSFACWSNGVDALLPRAENLLFVDDRSGTPCPLFTVAWDKAAAVLGPNLEKTDYVPARYRVRCFPDAGQLAALRELQSGPEAT